MTLRDELSEKAAALEASADAHEREGRLSLALAEAERAQAKTLREAADKVLPLPGGIVADTLSDSMMLTPGQIGAAKQTAEKRKKGQLHPLQQWLYDPTPGKPSSLADIAERLGLKEEKVRAWCRLVGPNRVAESVAKKIQARWGFQAIASNWPNGIKPDKKR